MSKIAVVTGGTSGIGRETALYLANHDCTVYELSRRAEGVAGLRHISADVTDELSVQAAVSQILAEAGRIDILVNSAGFGISGAVEFTDTEEAIRQMNVNFFGMVRMNRAVIAAMRQQGGGRIVNLSSVAAPVPIPFQTYYSASKAAISSYGAWKRAAPLRHHGLRRAARGYKDRLYRRPAQGHPGGRCVRRPHQPLCGAHGA